MRIHRIITSYMYLSTALILPRKIGNCLHLEGKSAWGSPRSWDWLNQRERGKKFSFINRKQNYLEQESTNFSINAIVSTLSLQAIWSLLQLHNLMGESSQKQYGNTWVCLCSNKALFTQTGNRLWPTKMSCDLPTLNLECCFPLLKDVLLIYLYISNQLHGPRTTMMVEIYKTFIIDWTYMQIFSLGPTETNHPVLSISPDTLNLSPFSLTWTLTMES